MRKITLVAGGTGGHVFPAIALAEHLHENLKNKNVALELITDQRGARFVKADARFEHKVWPVWRSPRWRYPFSLIWHGIRSAWHFLWKRPVAVIGFGGYPTLMPLKTAQILGLTTYLHEQNRYLGKANRHLAPKANGVWMTHALDQAPHHYKLVGNIVRSSLMHVKAWECPQENELLRILILGGSQGSAFLGEQLANQLVSLNIPFEVVHQCRDVDAVETMYKNHKIPCKVFSFIDDISFYYEWSQLVISRSGASTVSELQTVKRPAIFIPFAAATEGDQTYNAKSAASWSWMIEEKNINQLSDLLKNIAADHKLLKTKVSEFSNYTFHLDTILKCINEQLAS